MVSFVLVIIQLAATLVVGVYFYRQLRQQKKNTPAVRRESSREMDRLNRMRNIHLSEPLAEKVRPARFEDIIGQEDGIKSLKAILCGANPQHVLIYGPPGVGKTRAARLVLEAAKQSKGTPARYRFFAQASPAEPAPITQVRGRSGSAGTGAVTGAALSRWVT